MKVSRLAVPRFIFQRPVLATRPRSMGALGVGRIAPVLCIMAGLTREAAASEYAPLPSMVCPSTGVDVSSLWVRKRGRKWGGKPSREARGTVRRLPVSQYPLLTPGRLPHVVQWAMRVPRLDLSGRRANADLGSYGWFACESNKVRRVIARPTQARSCF